MTLIANMKVPLNLAQTLEAANINVSVKTTHFGTLCKVFLHFTGFGSTEIACYFWCLYSTTSNWLLASFLLKLFKLDV